MAITNQQIADFLRESAKRTAEQTAAFSASIERLIENDNRHHEAFRKRIEDLSLAQAAIRAEIQQNSDHRRLVGKWIFAVILIPVGTLIFQLILK